MATSSTWVNSDGTLTTEQHAGPIRSHDAHGAWQDVDLTLAEQADGSVAPKGHPGGLRLSGRSKSASLAAPSAIENDVVSTDEGNGGAQGGVVGLAGQAGQAGLGGQPGDVCRCSPGGRPGR